MKRKLLLIMPNFFDYPQAICEELEKMGYEVDCFDDRPSTNGMVKAIIRVNKNLIGQYINRYFEKVMKTVRAKKYDVVFLISGQSLSFSEDMIQQIKDEQPQAKYVLYQWDSLKNFPYIEKIEPYFDKCYSFDKNDVATHENLKFLPLFYTRRYENIGNSKKREFQYDFCFVGTAHPKKYKFIQMMTRQLKEVYLPRTEGISSSEVRSEQCKLRMGIVGKAAFRTKFVAESKYVNGVDVIGVCASQKSEEPEFDGMFYTENYDELLEKVDAVYIVSKPEKHYIDTKKALLAGKHVLCESPIALKEADCEELYSIAEEHGLVLMDAIKTAYSTAYERLVLLAKSGKIGKVVSVDAVCTSLRDGISIAGTDLTQKWNSMCGWAPAALLPVFQILGTEYRKKVITTKFLDEAANMDAFTKIDFTYDDAVASIKVAKAAKSEGELIVTGTKGYIYVPAPWWKTDYFEVRYENPEDNQRFFYQLDGEGIRYEIVAFAKSVEVKKPMNYVEKGVSKSIAKIIESFNDRTDMIVI